MALNYDSLVVPGVRTTPHVNPWWIYLSGKTKLYCINFSTASFTIMFVEAGKMCTVLTWKLVCAVNMSNTSFACLAWRVCWACLPVCTGSGSKICWILGYSSSQYRRDGDSFQVRLVGWLVGWLVGYTI